jgi:tripartite-type tricarboxylate transporter receptor subunit TctC
VPVIVENKPAQGRCRRRVTAKAAPDGYTIMGGMISTHAINASRTRIRRTIQPRICPDHVDCARAEQLVVNPAIPAKDVKELIVLLKANPTKYTSLVRQWHVAALVGRTLQVDGGRRDAAFRTRAARRRCRTSSADK